MIWATVRRGCRLAEMLKTPLSAKGARKLSRIIGTPQFSCYFPDGWRCGLPSVSSSLELLRCRTFHTHMMPTSAFTAGRKTAGETRALVTARTRTYASLRVCLQDPGAPFLWWRHFLKGNLRPSSCCRSGRLRAAALGPPKVLLFRACLVETSPGLTSFCFCGWCRWWYTSRLRRTRRDFKSVVRALYLMSRFVGYSACFAPSEAQARVCVLIDPPVGQTRMSVSVLATEQAVAAKER